MTEPAQKPGRSKQDYGTPSEFIEVFVRQFGGIVLDVCASPSNAIGPRYYTEEQNGLAQPWASPSQGWNWCNPPFGKCGAWVSRAWIAWENYGQRVAVLVPASVDSNWWADYVHGKALVFFLRGRMRFVGARDVYPKPLALLLYDGRRGYEPWRWKPIKVRKGVQASAQERASA